MADQSDPWGLEPMTAMPMYTGRTVMKRSACFYLHRMAPVKPLPAACLTLALHQAVAFKSSSTMLAACCEGFQAPCNNAGTLLSHMMTRMQNPRDKLPSQTKPPVQ